MNIFFLDRDPVEAARAHNDKHVIKMILETAQLLSTAHHALDTEPPEGIYKMTHRHHPCAIWVQQSKQHYAWTHRLLEELCIEYTYRYGKVHKTQSSGVVHALRYAPPALPLAPWNDPPQCMPTEYQIGGPVQAYRAYYTGPKARLAGWKHRGQPAWWPDNV